jgi:thiol-disulfide isomerase/thioredoxin
MNHCMNICRGWLLVLTLWLSPAWAADAPQVEFALPDIDGHSHDISQYRGRWVIVNYWASWCPPCLMEIPELVAFQARHYPSRAVVLGVNYERIDTRALRGVIARMAINYPVLRADRRQPGTFGPPSGLPVTYVIGPDGRLVTRYNGPVSRAQLEALIGGWTPEPRLPAGPRRVT